MLSFEHIAFFWGLLLLLPLALLFVWVVRWKQKTKKLLGDEALINRLTGDYSSKLYRLKFIVMLAALVLCITAATNLRKPVSGEKEKTAGIDVVFAIDVSKSMLSSDIKPNRLERAKQLAGLLTAKSGNNRIGIVLFAGDAYLQMPLTPDITEAKIYLSNVSVDAVPVQGTNISSALQLCNRSLDTKEKSHKAVVLISDGEDHDPAAEKAAQQLLDNGVILYTVGIGTAEGSPIMEPGAATYKTDASGKTIISRLNEAELKNIAARTGGQYFHLDNVQATAGNVSAALSGMEKKLIEAGGEREYLSFAPLFIAIALLLLVMEVFIPEIKRKQL